MLKPNFQSITSRTYNGSSLLSFILAKSLLLDISCEKIFALSILIALTACLFSVKKCVKMSIFFYVKAVTIIWRLGFYSHTPGCGSLFVKSWVRHWWRPFFALRLILVVKYTNALKERFRPTFSNKGRLSKIGWRSLRCTHRIISNHASWSGRFTIHRMGNFSLPWKTLGGGMLPDYWGWYVSPSPLDFLPCPSNV